MIQLGPEVLLQIAEDTYTYTEPDQWDLYNLALVSRDWRNPATATIWREIVIFTESGLQYNLRHFRQHKSIANHVKDIWIEGMGDDDHRPPNYQAQEFQELLGFCTNLETLKTDQVSLRKFNLSNFTTQLSIPSSFKSINYIASAEDKKLDLLRAILCEASDGFTLDLNLNELEVKAIKAFKTCPAFKQLSIQSYGEFILFTNTRPSSCLLPPASITGLEKLYIAGNHKVEDFSRLLSIVGQSLKLFSIHSNTILDLSTELSKLPVLEVLEILETSIALRINILQLIPSTVSTIKLVNLNHLHFSHLQQHFRQGLQIKKLVECNLTAQLYETLPNSVVMIEQKSMDIAELKVILSKIKIKLARGESESIGKMEFDSVEMKVPGESHMYNRLVKDIALIEEFASVGVELSVDDWAKRGTR